MGEVFASVKQSSLVLTSIPQPFSDGDAELMHVSQNEDGRGVLVHKATARLGGAGRGKARSLLFMITTGVETMKGLAVIGAIIAGIIGIYTAMFA